MFIKNRFKHMSGGLTLLCLLAMAIAGSASSRFGC
jgi:hypothetical protein